MRILGVIPARGGSVRVPRKNRQRVGGFTLAGRAVQCAARVLDRVVLSTDDPELISTWYDDDDCYEEFYPKPFAEHHAIRLRERPPELCGSDVPMAAVLQDALDWAESEEAMWQCGMLKRYQWQPESAVERFNAVVTIQPTSPLREPGDVAECVRQWLQFSECDREHDRRAVVTVDRTTGQRNGAVYLTPVPMLREGLVFRGMGVPPCDTLVLMPASRSLDINTPEDLEEARRILGP